MSLSKHVVHSTCAQIVHPWDPSCLRASQSIAYDSLVGGLKLLVPLLFINHGLSIWKKKKIPAHVRIKDFLIDIVRCSSVGACFSTSSMLYNCMLRNLIGHYTYGTLAFIPSAAAGLTSVNVLSSKMRRQVLVPFTNSALESVVRLMSSFGWLTLNRYTETVFFMVTNACLMYAFRVSNSGSGSGYTWFFKPEKCPGQDVQLFLDTVFKKTRYYFGLGLGFGVIRTILGDTSVLKPRNMHKMFDTRTLRPGIFAGSYVILYETIVYAMNRYFQKDRSLYAVPAGFLAGLSYTFDPNLAINISAFINLIQILYSLAGIQLLRPSIMESVMFCLCFGTMVHIKLLYPKDAAKFCSKMLDLCSGNKMKLMSETILKHAKYAV